MKQILYSFSITVAVFIWMSAVWHVATAQDHQGNKPPQHILEMKANQHAGEGALTAAPESVEAVPEQLTMASAMALAIRKNPSLSAFSSEIRIKDAAALQARLLPNPELSLEVENFGGQGALKKFTGAEMTIAFSQVIEMGGKRRNRWMKTIHEKNLAAWDFQSAKLDILASTAKAFVDVLVAQEQVVLNKKLLQSAKQIARTVREKVKSGNVSPVENSRAQLGLATADIEVNRAVRHLEAVRRHLAGFWGAEQATYARVEGQLDRISALPDQEAIKDFLIRNPDFLRWTSEIEQKKAALQLAYSEIVPDLTLSAGVRNFRESANNAFLLGVSIPLPVHNRNQAGITEAMAGIDKAHAEKQSAKVRLGTIFSETWRDLSTAYTEVTTYRDAILPNAKTTFEAAEQSYKEGKLDFLQLLDAQRTLFMVKRQYLLSLGAYHRASIDMERLLGIPLNDVKKTDDSR